MLFAVMWIEPEERWVDGCKGYTSERLFYMSGNRGDKRRSDPQTGNLSPNRNSDPQTGTLTPKPVFWPQTSTLTAKPTIWPSNRHSCHNVHELRDKALWQGWGFEKRRSFSVETFCAPFLLPAFLCDNCSSQQHGERERQCLGVTAKVW